MPFIINQNIVSFSDYKSLHNHGQLDTDFVSDIISFLELWHNSKVDAISQKTSGSTGTPKMISMSKHMMRQSAINTINYFDLNKNSTALLALPVKYIAGKMMLVRALIADLNLVIQSPSANPMNQLSQDIDFVALTPHQLYNGIQSGNTKQIQIKHILLGGAPVSKALFELIQKSNHRCYLSYGMTETASHIAIQKLNGTMKTDHFTAMPGIELSVGNDDCLIIKGDYLDQEIITNDIVELISKDKFIWKGRKDNVINSGGIKLIPEQIEAALSQYIDAPFFVSSLPDEMLGQKLIVLIEQNEEESDLDKNKLLSQCKALDILPVVPEIVSISAFVHTPNGKILRKETFNLAFPKLLKDPFRIEDERKR